jgi:hypothetical protein
MGRGQQDQTRAPARPAHRRDGAHDPRRLEQLVHQAGRAACRLTEPVNTRLARQSHLPPRSQLFRDTPSDLAESAILQQVRDEGSSGFDPTDAIRGLNCPGLWLYGGEDQSQPTAEDRRALTRLSAAGHDFQFVVSRMQITACWMSRPRIAEHCRSSCDGSAKRSTRPVSCSLASANPCAITLTLADVMLGAAEFAGQHPRGHLDRIPDR